MRKAHLFLGLLAVVLLLAGCQKEEPAQTSLTEYEILQAMLASQPEIPYDLYDYEAQGMMDEWIKIWEENLNLSENHILGIANTNGYAGSEKNWVELVVFRLSDQVSQTQVEEAMLSYLEELGTSRAGTDRGIYTAEQNGCFFQMPYAALVICPDPDAAAEAFHSCLSGGTARDTAWEDTEKVTWLNVPYQVPKDQPKEIYDLGPVRDACLAGDPAGLSGQDLELYEVCMELSGTLFSPEMSDYEKEIAAHDWLVAQVVPGDAIQELGLHLEFQTPYGGLVLRQANCLGFSSAFQLLMDLAEVECVTVYGAANQNGRFHAWNMVCLDGNWYHVDVSWDRGRNSYLYFNVSSDFMARTDHRWIREQYPEAKTDGPRPNRFPGER